MKELRPTPRRTSAQVQSTRLQLEDKILLAKRLGCRLVEIGHVLCKDWGVLTPPTRSLSEEQIDREVDCLVEDALGAGSLFNQLLSDIGELRLRETRLVIEMKDAPGSQAVASDD